MSTVRDKVDEMIDKMGWEAHNKAYFQIREDLLTERFIERDKDGNIFLRENDDMEEFIKEKLNALGYVEEWDIEEETCAAICDVYYHLIVELLKKKFSFSEEEIGYIGEVIGCCEYREVYEEITDGTFEVFSSVEEAFKDWRSAVGYWSMGMMDSFLYHYLELPGGRCVTTPSNGEDVAYKLNRKMYLG